MRLPTAQPAACNWSRGAAAHTLVTESAQSLPAGGCRKGEWRRDGNDSAGPPLFFSGFAPGNNVSQKSLSGYLSSEP